MRTWKITRFDGNRVVFRVVEAMDIGTALRMSGWGECDQWTLSIVELPLELD